MRSPLQVNKAATPTDLRVAVQGAAGLLPGSWSTDSVEILEDDSSHFFVRSTKTLTEQPAFQLRVQVQRVLWPHALPSDAVTGNRTSRPVSRNHLPALRTGASFPMKTSRLPFPLRLAAGCWASCLSLVPSLPIASAQDGFRSWNAIESPTATSLSRVAYGNGRWLALGNTVLTSIEGLTWTEVVNPQGFPADAQTWGRLRSIHDRFVLEGAWKQTVDGQTWSDFPVPGGRTIHAVTFADGKWMCVGGDGLFATATTPGDWTIHAIGLTSDAIQSLVYLNGTWLAFSHQSSGMRPFSSTDGVHWTIQPIVNGSSFSDLETGEIRKTDGTVESVAVGTTNAANLVIVRSSQGNAILEERERATFGRLVFRRSGRIDDPEGVRREWVNIEFCCHNQHGPQIYTLAAPGETPRTESLNTTNDLVDLAAGPNFMIAVGTGGMIRRYGTQPPGTPPSLSADIHSAVEISWAGRTGASYMIQESLDGQTWVDSLPTTLPGKASIMKWYSPVGSTPRRLFRVQEF